MAQHEFVIVPNHFHLLLTPAAEVPLEKALLLIKGGFSYRAKRELHFAFEIWQASFVNHRIRDAEDYKHHHTYIGENPVKARLAGDRSCLRGHRHLWEWNWTPRHQG